MQHKLPSKEIDERFQQIFGYFKEYSADLYQEIEELLIMRPDKQNLILSKKFSTGFMKKLIPDLFSALKIDSLAPLK